MLPSPPHYLLTGASLLLDLDGTLVEIASKPDGIRVDHRLRELLARLSQQFDGRLAIISGRPVDQLRVRLYTYGREVLAVAARLYQGQATNMRTAGGGFAPVFLVDGETPPTGIERNCRGEDD